MRPGLTDDDLYQPWHERWSALTGTEISRERALAIRDRVIEIARGPKGVETMRARQMSRAQRTAGL